MNDDWAIELVRILDHWRGRDVHEDLYVALIDFARLIEIWEEAE